MDQQMKEELEQLQDVMSEVNIKVTGIMAFLRGNELDREDKGLVGKVNDHEKRIKKIEKQRDVVMYFLAFTSLPTGIGVWELLQKFLLK